jgi:hypothetical protein
MAYSGQCAYPSGAHPACAACGNFVFRKSPHVHAYYSNPSREDIVCGLCWRVVRAAAVPVLRAAEALGIDATAPYVNDALDQGKIVVLCQTTLGFLESNSAN